MSKVFNIFSQLKEEIRDFDEEGIYIVGKKGNFQAKNKRGTDGGYYHSQKDLLESIDLASASKFKTGIFDDEGQRKTYLNVVNFYRDVMKMKININVSNYIFEPTSLDFVWPVWMMDRQFKRWAEGDNYEHKIYDDEIDEYAHDLATYGTCVSKKLADCTERVPLRTLRNTQNAKSLNQACKSGGYAIIESEMHYNDMKEYPGWNVEGLSKHKTYIVYERYGLVPKRFLEEKEEGEKEWKTANFFDLKPDDEMVLTMTILLPNGKFQRSESENASGRILFMEELDDIPLQECHAEKIDGRWIGRGEIEKQLENQISRNLNANLRRRGLLWATKKIYQSSDDEVQKNLVIEAKDGDVLKVKPNGQISQINTQNQHLGEFSQDEESWKENSKEISFAFEVATGETMPSNTPFRLGLVLDRAVSSHFKLVRKTFSSYLKRSFFEQLIPIFKEEYSGEHSMHFAAGESDIEALREAMAVFHSNLRYFDQMIYGDKPPLMEAIRLEVDDEMERSPYYFVEMPDKFYDNIHAFMKLNLDEDIGPDIETLTNIWQTMVQQGDPRAETVLKRIMAKRGRSLDAIRGTLPKSGGAKPPAESPEGPTPSPAEALPRPETIA